jgi:hypothetical protein
VWILGDAQRSPVEKWMPSYRTQTYYLKSNGVVLMKTLTLASDGGGARTTMDILVGWTVEEDDGQYFLFYRPLTSN